MWIEVVDITGGYIPRDNKFHNIQIVNDNLYIDGQLLKPVIDLCDGHGYNRALTADEIRAIYEEGKEQHQFESWEAHAGSDETKRRSEDK